MFLPIGCITDEQATAVKDSLKFTFRIYVHNAGSFLVSLARHIQFLPHTFSIQTILLSVLFFYFCG